MPRSVSWSKTTRLTSMRDLLGRDAEDGHPGRRGPCWRSRRAARPRCRTSRGRRRSPRPCPSSRWTSCEVALARVDGDRVAPIRVGQLAAEGVRLADDDVAGTGVAGDGRGHQPDRPGADDQHVLAEDREGERGVDRVAERVEDRGDLLVDARPVVPDVGHRQDDLLGEGAVALDARGRSCWRTGASARRGSGGSGRR